ncbi:hypothetical protein pb186bvf_001388 [Paramecium bursaria]
MGLLSFVGRVLLVLVILGAGVDKFQNGAKSVKLLEERYPLFHTHFAQLTKPYFQLPVQIEPAHLKVHYPVIIQAVGGLEVGLAVFIIFFNSKFAGILLSYLILSFILVIHNPALAKDSTRAFEIFQALYNLGIAGGLLLVGQRAAESQSKVSESKAPQQSSQKNRKKRD